MASTSFFRRLIEGMALLYHETDVPIVLGDRVRMMRGRHGHAGLGTVVYVHPMMVQIRLDNPSRGESVITVAPRSFTYDNFVMVAEVAEAAVVPEMDEAASPGCLPRAPVAAAYQYVG